jgi:TonB family protein
VRAGSTLGVEDLAALRAAIQRFDEHLTLTSVPATEGVELRIAAPGARLSATPTVVSRGSGGVLGGTLSSTGNAGGSGGVLGGILSSTGEAAPSSPPPPRISIAGGVPAGKIVKMVKPVYPPLAKQARIQGTVVLNVVVGQDGAVISVALANGHALLAPAAIEAVRQWVFQPTLLNGQPVEVASTIEVNFALAEEAQQ